MMQWGLVADRSRGWGDRPPEPSRSPRERPPAEGNAWRRGSQTPVAWRRDPEDQGVCNDEVDIQEMVEEWARTQAERDYERSDRMRDRLRARGVNLDDRNRMWAIQRRQYGNPVDQSQTHRRDPKDEGADGSAADKALAEEVEGLLRRRQELRADRRFDEADAIREELRTKGVFFDDKAMTWTTTPRVRRSEANPDAVSLMVFNVPPAATWQSLKDYFATAGEVEYADIYTDPRTREPTDRAVVRFASAESIPYARELVANSDLLGSWLELKEDTRRGTPSRGGRSSRERW